MLNRITAPHPNLLPPSLLAAIHGAYQIFGMVVTNAAQREPESAKYGACRLGLEGQVIAYRVAKTTSTKIGQFVTLWKRPVPGGPLVPIDMEDGVAFVVIHVHDANNANNCGQFVFERSLLLAKKIMSSAGKGGKLATRVYPPWSTPTAKAAIQTPRWQLPYFLPLLPEGKAEFAMVRRLFKI
jgi:hypothetical protein